MKMLGHLEDSLVGLSEKLPSLPEGFNRGLANWAWLLSAIAGVVSLLSAWSLLALSRYINAACALGACPTSLGIFYYLSIAMAVGYGILYLIAAKPLKAMNKRGWDLIFLATVVNLASIVIYLLAGLSGSLISAIITVAISWFFLFQIRPKFLPAKEA